MGCKRARTMTTELRKDKILERLQSGSDTFVDIEELENKRENPQRIVWKKMKIQLVVLEAKLAVLWLGRKSITAQISRLPRDLLQEIVLYL